MVREVIFNTIFNRVLDRILKDDVPVSNKQAEHVAKEVTKEVAPIVVNATNSEHWYQSRIFIGLLAAVLGFIGNRVGITFIEGDVSTLVEIIASLVQAAGLLYAWYGRVKGNTLKPLGTK